MIVAGVTVWLLYQQMGADAFSARGAAPMLVGMSMYFLILFSLEATFDRMDTNSRMRQIDRFSRADKILREREDLIDSGSFFEEILFKLQRSLNISETHLPEVRRRLIQAGYYRERTIVIYIILRILFPIIGLAIGGLIFFTATSKLYGVLALAVGAGVGFFGVDVVLKSKIKTRYREIYEKMPDILDMFVIYTESGQSFDASLVRVIENMKSRYPVPMAELRVLERELRVLPERRRAFDNLIQRCNLDIMKRFTDVLKQSDEMGSSISEALKILSADTRKERMLEAERKAAKIPIYIQFPIVIFTLPALFILIMTPAVIRLLESLKHITG